MKTLSTIAILALLGFPTTGEAAESREPEWAIFVEGECDSDQCLERDQIQHCWVVATPDDTVNTRGDEVVSVRRGNILFFVSFQPEASISGEISFTGGYPFDEETPVEVEVGDEVFQMFTDGEWAWPASPEEDELLIQAMMAGEEAEEVLTITGLSTRGTTTEDEFRLFGFTEKLNEAEETCNP